MNNFINKNKVWFFYFLMYNSLQNKEGIMKLTKKEINIINELSQKCKISNLETVNYLLKNKDALEICGLSK